MVKPWRFVAAVLLGFALGFASGVTVGIKLVDKPQTVNNIKMKRNIFQRIFSDER
ncbi:hypothetical protein [Persicobacter sp. CCB-QB2]|uniref:hypothetical protein n=1 Tax=Persicobacter sp. CCB-QB2 TaxID=1561025 RepID=UPI0012F7C7B3|nr:hypothetical protein [Persicobacter sp. CCB-QB2]